MNTKTVGLNGEQAVLEYMLARDFRLIVRNFEVHNTGELDLVFEKEEDIYIIEVRSRKNKGDYPDSAQSVTASKRRKIRNATNVLISKYGLYDRNIHFLVGQVTHNEDGLVQNVEILPF